MNASPTAPVAEIFFSFQGEGPRVGTPQLFLRFQGCDLSCYYCDTPDSRRVEGPCRLYPPQGASYTEMPNPLSVDQVVEALDELLAAPETAATHSLALTGGEPLLRHEFIAALAPECRSRKLPLYLETGGHHPTELDALIHLLDFVSLDYKLPSTLPEPLAPELFEESVRLASQLSFHVKIVVTDHTTPEEFSAACRSLAAVEPLTPLVLQPVTGTSPAGGPPSQAHLLRLQALAAQHLSYLRLIPQCHKLLGLR